MRPSLLLALSVLAALALACVRGSGPMPDDLDADLDRQEAQSFCAHWRSLGSSADAAPALKRAEFALVHAEVPLPEGACLTRARLATEALSSAEAAVRGLPQDSAAWVVLGDCRSRFGQDRAGAAAAVCKAADLAPADRALLVRCGDLLLEVGRRAEAVPRWRAALGLPGTDADGYRILDNLSAAGGADAPFLESLPAALVAGYAQWKRDQGQGLDAGRDGRARPGPRDESETRERSATDELNERVREKVREMREEEQANE